MNRITVVASVIILGNLLYAGDNFYQGDSFNKRHSAGKESFIRSVAKNRAYSHMGDASYTEVNGKEEFKEALKSGQLDKKVDSNKITNSYNVIDIKNVRLNKNDLKDLDGDKLLIGSDVDKDGEKLMQTIDIKNSKIETDKQLNVGVVSSTEDVSGIDSITNIKGSSLKGGKKQDSKDVSRLDLFEQLEKENAQ